MPWKPVIGTAAAVVLVACATTPSGAGGNLAHLGLFAADGAPRFTFYLACAGQVAAET
jgi:hypothetical protein